MNGVLAMSSSSSSRSSRSPLHARAGKPQNLSPPRIPLHDRSNSQANIYGLTTSPTIRIVDDSDATVYAKSPYPSQPSQILRPRNAPAGYVYQDRGHGVSDQEAASNAPSETLAPKPLHLRKSNRTSAATSASTFSDDETVTCNSPFVASSPRFSQDSTPPLSPVLHTVDKIKSLEIVAEEPSSDNSKPTVRAVVPSIASSTPPAQRLNSPPSKASLASSTSGSSIIHYHGRSSSASSLNLPSQPTRQAQRPFYAYPRIKKRGASSQADGSYARLQQSSESLSSSNRSRGSIERPRSASNPASLTHAVRQATSDSLAQYHHPVVRPVQAGGSLEESRSEQSPTRMSERISGHKWSSQLSTIHSESDRNSHVTSISGQGPYARGATIASVASSGDLPHSNPTTTSSVSVPRPLFSPQTQIDPHDLDENDDTIAELQSPPLRHQRSGYFSRFSSDHSRPSSSRSRPGTASSSQSDLANFIASTIPAWARVYYRRGERTSLPAPDTSTEASESRLNTAQSGPSLSPTEPNFPLSIYRPRNRPHRGSRNTNSMVISEIAVENDLYVVGHLRHHLQDEYGTPRLYLDRRNTAQLSAWQAPSFRDSWGSLFTRGNRQILCFGIGFLFPLAWILGAMLPLPLPPELTKEATPSQINVEHVMSRHLNPIDQLQYQKARWWRNLNRIMSVVGVLLIGTIITLAVFAAKMT